MATATLGTLSWRIDPTEIDFGTQLDLAVQETIGGQVVQVLGSTTTDITVTGLFGVDREHKLESWQLAEAFHRRIQTMIDAQTSKAGSANMGAKDTKNWSQGNISTHLGSNAPIHAPLEFTYLDGVHDWRFRVLIKSLADADGNGSLVHKTGKFSYGYTLTLFVVQALSDEISRVASDRFVSRISNGFGWSRSPYNGPLTTDEAVAYIQQNGGTVSGYFTNILTGAGTATTGAGVKAPGMGQSNAGSN